MCALILPVLSFLHYTVSLSLAFFIVCSCISCRPRVDRVVSIVGGVVVIVVVSLVVSPPNVIFSLTAVFRLQSKSFIFVGLGRATQYGSTFRGTWALTRTANRDSEADRCL